MKEFKAVKDLYNELVIKYRDLDRTDISFDIDYLDEHSFFHVFLEIYKKKMQSQQLATI